MTTVKIRLNQDNVRITIKGHAEAKRVNDSDLVCSSISILSTTLVQCLLDATDKGYIEKYDYNTNDGDVSIKFSIVREGLTMINAILYTIFTGFELLQNQYPDNVKIIK